MQAHHPEFSLMEMADALVVSVSGYRAWKGGGTPWRKHLTDAQMVALIRPSMPNSRAPMAAPGWSGNCGGVAFRRARNGLSG